MRGSEPGGIVEDIRAAARALRMQRGFDLVGQDERADRLEAYADELEAAAAAPVGVEAEPPSAALSDLRRWVEELRRDEMDRLDNAAGQSVYTMASARGAVAALDAVADMLDPSPAPAAAPLEEPPQIAPDPDPEIAARVEAANDLPVLRRPDRPIAAPAPVEDAQEPPATPEQRVKGLMESLGNAVDRAKAERRAAQEPPVEERCAFRYGHHDDRCGITADNHYPISHPFVPPTARPETEVERDG